MSEQRPARVRVTAPRRHDRRAATPRRREQIDAETPLGEIYMRSLLREQLRLAGATLVMLAIGIGSLPALFHFVPGLAGVRLGPVPLSWLLIGVLVYPYLVALGWWYVRAAERNEADFVDLLETDELPR